MNAKDYQIQVAQQESIWLRLAKSIVRADAHRQAAVKQLTNQEVSHAEVQHGQ